MPWGAVCTTSLIYSGLNCINYLSNQNSLWTVHTNPNILYTAHCGLNGSMFKNAAEPAGIEEMHELYWTCIRYVHQASTSCGHKIDISELRWRSQESHKRNQNWSGNVALDNHVQKYARSSTFKRSSSDHLAREKCNAWATMSCRANRWVLYSTTNERSSLVKQWRLVCILTR